MSPQAKEEYIEALYKRYKEASRQENVDYVTFINEAIGIGGLRLIFDKIDHGVTQDDP